MLPSRRRRQGLDGLLAAPWAPARAQTEAWRQASIFMTRRRLEARTVDLRSELDLRRGKRMETITHSLARRAPASGGYWQPQTAFGTS